MIKYPWLASIYRATRELCRVLSAAWPVIHKIPFTPAELAAITALKAACEDLLAQGPLPGEDDDPTTPT